jgi:hypothetical protein
MIKPDSEEPLPPETARFLIRRLVVAGAVAFSNHALEEMQKDGLTAEDCLAVLRAGWVLPAEIERGTWRYRVVMAHLTAVIAFRAPAALVVVTTWRSAR